MKPLKLYYATNRKHVGKDRFKPESYGIRFSDDGMENLRFGTVSVTADEKKINSFLGKESGYGQGAGERLTGYLTDQVRDSAKIEAFEEQLDPKASDEHQPGAKLGSLAMFDELQQIMLKAQDVVIYIHGYNVSWQGAVGSALALQEMLRLPVPNSKQESIVVLFTWPSDGMMLPFVSYASDRADAAASGNSFGRSILKFRDFLARLRSLARLKQATLCDQDVHLLCHSMGNFVLQNALGKIEQFTPGSCLPRLFKNIFLCAPDVDDTVLEPDQPMGRLHQLADYITVYHNREDRAIYLSDATKGNPARLGEHGAARPALIHQKIHQVDCSPIVKGVVEHGYYLNGRVNEDIRYSINDIAFDKRPKLRMAVNGNLWKMK
jgi:esterase/lipase superfamily enzyme